MKTFVSADHHFGHRNIILFEQNGVIGRTKNGVPFRDIYEHDAWLIRQHNSVVQPEDRCYFLGDFLFNGNLEEILNQMNGEKILVAGNHDTYTAQEYLDAGFADVRGIVILKRQKRKLALTHVPIHLGDRWALNIHGHMHSWSMPDPRYQCVSIEQLDNGRPIAI